MNGAKDMGSNDIKKPEKKRGAVRVIIEKAGEVLVVIASLALFFMMLSMFADAMGRKFIGAVPGAFETCSALLVVVMFLSLAFAQRNGRHIAIDVVTRFLPQKWQNILTGIGAVLGAVIFALLTWHSWAEALHCTRVNEVWSGIIDYPVWPFRWVVPVGSAALMLQFLLTAFDKFRNGYRG